MKRSVLALVLCLATLAACEETDSPYAEVDAALQAGDYGRAVELATALQSELGFAPDLVQRIGVAHEEQGDPAKAVVVYRKALKEHPEAGRLWVALGNTYLDLRQFERAVEAIRKGRELGVDDRFTAFSLGICLGQLRQNEEAEAEFELARATGTQPNDVDYNVALLRMDDNRFREAITLLEGVVAAEPENCGAVRELGNAMLRADSGTPATVERVQQMAWQVIDCQPDDYRAHMLLGDSFMAQEDYEAAVEAFTNALEQGQNPPEVETRYVEAATRQKQAERAASQEG